MSLKENFVMIYFGGYIIRCPKRSLLTVYIDQLFTVNTGRLLIVNTDQLLTKVIKREVRLLSSRTNELEAHNSTRNT